MRLLLLLQRTRSVHSLVFDQAINIVRRGMSLLNNTMGLFSHPAMQFYLSTTEQMKQHYASAAALPRSGSPSSGPATSASSANLSMFSIDNILAGTPRAHLFGPSRTTSSGFPALFYPPTTEGGSQHHQPGFAGQHHAGLASSPMHSAEIMQGTVLRNDDALASYAIFARDWWACLPSRRNTATAHSSLDKSSL